MVVMEVCREAEGLGWRGRKVHEQLDGVHVKSCLQKDCSPWVFRISGHLVSRHMDCYFSRMFFQECMNSEQFGKREVVSSSWSKGQICLFSSIVPSPSGQNSGSVTAQYQRWGFLSCTVIHWMGRHHVASSPFCFVNAGLEDWLTCCYFPYGHSCE